MTVGIRSKPRRLSIEHGEISRDARVDDSRYADGEELSMMMTETLDEALAVVCHEARSRERLDPTDAPLDEKPIGDAAWTPRDLASGWVRRVLANTGELFQSRLVIKGENRMVWHRSVQFDSHVGRHGVYKVAGGYLGHRDL